MKVNPDAERLYLFVRHLGRRLDAVDAARGLSPARFSVLANLAFHEIETVGGLAKKDHVSRPAMTRLARDMERDGLVRKIRDAKDGRVVHVRLTKKGRMLLDQARNQKMALIARHIADLQPSARDSLQRALEALTALDNNTEPNGKIFDELWRPGFGQADAD